MKRKQIFITASFRKRLKKLRRQFSEDDVVDNIKEFIRLGLRKGESLLTNEPFGNVIIVIVKCRIRKHQAVGRYLLGIINEHEYLPIFIDLKTGVYGKNLSFTASKHVVSMLDKALADVLADYLEHTDEDPRLTTYPIYEDT